MAVSRSPTRPFLLRPNLALWATIGVGALSLGAGLLNVFGVRQAAETIALGEGESLLVALDERHRGARRPPETSDLERFAEEHPQVTYLALLRPDGTPIVSWGQSVFVDTPERGRSLTHAGAIYRVADRRPGPREGPPGAERPPAPDSRPPREGLGEPPRGPRPAGPPPRGPGGRRDVSLQIEFEPIVARQLSGRARLGLAVSLVIAALFVGAAFLLRKLLLDREAAERKSFEEERLRSLGEMSGVLAHELRTPLASLKGHTQLLAEGLDGTDGDRARRLVRDVGRLERLCADLLEFVRSGPLDIQVASIGHILEQARAMTPDPERIHVVLDDVPRWPLDASRIQQALSNLLRNALQADPKQEVELYASADEHRLRIEVLDRGQGIDTEDRERIFQPFFTTRTEGTGLGLAVVRRTVEMHGGSITCRERPGGGTRFRIDLPKGETS